jgi:hypothetical protein
LALCGATAHSAQPPRQDNSFEITPFIGYVAGGEFEDALDGSKRDLGADASWGVILNAVQEPGRHYELLYSQQGTQLQGAARMDMDVQYLQLGGSVSFSENTRVMPYFGLTVGAARFSPDEAGLDDETKFALSAAMGLRVPVNERIGVRFDARAFATLLGSDDDIFCASSQGATCRVRVKSDVFMQYAASLGVTIGF